MSETKTFVVPDNLTGNNDNLATIAMMNGGFGGGQKLEPVSKEYVDKTLEQYNIQLEKNIGCDYIFVANMCKADYYGSSITDEKHFALYIKDTIDDEDAGDGTTMRRWYATMVANGIMVDWEEFI